jgi:GT2 family glycosyltransferase
VIRLRHDRCPQVSIVVVTFSRRDLLERCLQSLAARISRAMAFETIVVLNDVNPQTRNFLERSVSGATLIASDVNAGFAGACNLGRLAAKGSFLALLNDDTEIEEGWLENLVATAERTPRAGAVGSAVLFPDGRIQEAGSILWNDGTTTPLSRGASSVPPEHDFVRDVDFCSACSLLVPTSVWDAVGGMDEEYFPGYYEDSDLCLRIRKRGLRILYTPRSRVRHHEGSSAHSHFRKFLVQRNRIRFREIWGSELADSEPPAPDSARSIQRALRRVRPQSRRLLIIDDWLPHHNRGSGFCRMLDVANALADDYAMSIWCAAGADAQQDTLRDLGIYVVPGPLDAHLSTPDVLYDAVLISRPHNFGRYADIVRKRQRHAAIIYDAEALYHRRLERRIALERDENTVAPLALEREDMRDLEGRIRSQVQAIVTISSSEASFFASCAGSCPIATIRPELPWARITTRSFEHRSGVLLVAAWLAGADSPNADGLKWFASDVWPRVTAAVPHARLRVTGGAPHHIRRETASPSIEFLDLVPDLYDVYDAARVTITPLRYGAGLSIKSLESLRFGVPVVSTTIGTADWDTLAPGAAWTADTASAFADGVIALLTMSEEWRIRRAAILESVQKWPASAGHQWRAIIDEAQLARTSSSVA